MQHVLYKIQFFVHSPYVNNFLSLISKIRGKILLNIDIITNKWFISNIWVQLLSYVNFIEAHPWEKSSLIFYFKEL